MWNQTIRQSFSNFFNSWHTEQSAKTVKAHHQFLRRDFIIKKTNIKNAFKSSIAKILIIVLFFKIMLIMDIDDFFIPQFLFASF
jgi:indole-3-glycerol phosphate synthase